MRPYREFNTNWNDTYQLQAPYRSNYSHKKVKAFRFNKKNGAREETCVLGYVTKEMRAEGWREIERGGTYVRPVKKKKR